MDKKIKKKDASKNKVVSFDQVINKMEAERIEVGPSKKENKIIHSKIKQNLP